jgi:hypothetical protein
LICKFRNKACARDMITRVSDDVTRRHTKMSWGVEMSPCYYRLSRPLLSFKLKPDMFFKLKRGSIFLQKHDFFVTRATRIQPQAAFSCFWVTVSWRSRAHVWCRRHHLSFPSVHAWSLSATPFSVVSAYKIALLTVKYSLSFCKYP